MCLNMRLQLRCAFWLLLPIFAAASCATDDDCSLNGVCLKGTCKCDPGWHGNDCGVLAIKATPLGAGFQHPNTSSWGGSVIKGPTKWHMYLSRMSESCGLTSWATNSEIVHAVSPTMVGPYVYSDTVLPRFAHNRTIHFWFILAVPHWLRCQCQRESSPCGTMCEWLECGSSSPIPAWRIGLQRAPLGRSFSRN